MTMQNALVAAVVCAALAPSTASAQDTASAGQAQTPSTMQVTQLKNGWLGAPDVKFSRVNDDAATLVGGYGGWVTEGTLLVGGGGYWLANRSDDFEMAYGGLVVEWLARTNHRIGFGARALVGGGTATLGLSYTDLYGNVPVPVDGRTMRFGHRDHRPPHGPLPPGDPTTLRYLVSENFFVAEPQANMLVNLTSWMRINAGVGYRFTGGTSFLEGRLNDVAATLAVQFGGGR
jgi:hypothetical protein